MVRDAVFFVVVVAVIVTAQKHKLFGAETVRLGEFPYMVSLRVFGEHECGGSIISSRYILTAAHCLKDSFVNDTSPLLIQYGVVDRRYRKSNNTVKVKNVIIHEDYVPPPESHPHDIALLELEEKIAFGPNVQPVKLPKRNISSDFDDIATLIGWGRTGFGESFSMDLLKVNVTLLTPKYCQNEYRNDSYYPQMQLCAGYFNAGACNGDSGGPLTVKGHQIGIVSWGSNICALEAPSVFTNVSYYRNWIKENSDV